MFIIGIDPGMTGGVALYGADEHGHSIAQAIDIPTSGEGAAHRVNAPALVHWITLCIGQKPNHAFIENAASMPGQGIASSFRYGRAAGALEAIVACCGIPITLVAPQTWKKHFGLRGPDKERSRLLAIQRLPAAAHLLQRKGDHGRGEALLLALYGYEIRTRGG